MNGLLAITCQPFKDCPARRIGKGLEDVICYERHRRNNNHLAISCQASGQGSTATISFVAEPQYRNLLSVDDFNLSASIASKNG